MDWYQILALVLIAWSAGMFAGHAVGYAKGKVVGAIQARKESYRAVYEIPDATLSQMSPKVTREFDAVFESALEMSPIGTVISVRRDPARAVHVVEVRRG